MQKQTSAQYLKELNILHTALIVGQVLFALAAFVFKTPDSTAESVMGLEIALVYIIPFFAIAGIFIGKFIFKRKIQDAKEKTYLADKLNDYKIAIITRFAFLEGASLFAVIAYLLTGELLFLLFSAVIIIAFIMLQPTKEHVIKDLDLSVMEIEKINDPDAIVE